MIVRDATLADHPAIREVLAAAFPTLLEADLVEQLRADGDVAFELVAEAADGQIVGHILFSPMDAPFRALALGPVAVIPDHQRNGVGAALIGAGNDRARSDGAAAIFLVGEPGYYRRFGYSADAAATFTSPYAGPCFMALALEDEMPGGGGEVLYAPAFSGFS